MKVIDKNYKILQIKTGESFNFHFACKLESLSRIWLKQLDFNHLQFHSQISLQIILYPEIWEMKKIQLFSIYFIYLLFRWIYVKAVVCLECLLLTAHI